MILCTYFYITIHIINITKLYGLRSVYGSTNPYAHIISMLSNGKATINVGIKLDVKKIPINLTLNEVSVIKLYHVDFAQFLNFIIVLYKFQTNSFKKIIHK